MNSIPTAPHPVARPAHRPHLLETDEVHGAGRRLVWCSIPAAFLYAGSRTGCIGRTVTATLSHAAASSGVRPATVALIEAMLTRGVTPVIPEKGSVGASGDLAPLSHLAIVLLGEQKELVQQWNTSVVALGRRDQALYAAAKALRKVQYSIKDIETFYRGKRSGDVQTAGASIVYYERYLETGDKDLLVLAPHYAIVTPAWFWAQHGIG